MREEKKRNERRGMGGAESLMGAREKVRESSRSKAKTKHEPKQTETKTQTDRSEDPPPLPLFLLARSSLTLGVPGRAGPGGAR